MRCLLSQGRSGDVLSGAVSDAISQTVKVSAEQKPVWIEPSKYFEGEF